MAIEKFNFFFQNLRSLIKYIDSVYSLARSLLNPLLGVDIGKISSNLHFLHISLNTKRLSNCTILTLLFTLP